MGQTENISKASNLSSSSPNESATKTKSKNQGKKRKRSSSDSNDGDDDMVLPDNALEMERNVHISAVKNNLDETSVRKIIKKVVTNDHVLALVKLREEEESSNADNKTLQPKLTRAKVKELKKVSPKTAWNLENLELTPINHIPVKTRPEVKALIAQELPEDEDDEEYEPTHDDLPSEDEHALESCSDVDSQPRTPATPASVSSPRVLQDGPFKVPQDVSSARRKLNVEEEEATIALRTRSKLSLSATPIEHIEATFVPPDDIPIQDVDDLWNEFLNECLNPASAARNEDDDETDPEYNVAADPDAQDEDEETLGKSIIKISKKELNDLVMELFNIMPAEEDLAENLAKSMLTDTSQNKTHCEAKQEPQSDEEGQMKPSQRLTFEKSTYPISIGKSEPEDCDEVTEGTGTNGQTENSEQTSTVQVNPKPSGPHLTLSYEDNKVKISVERSSERECVAPPSLRPKLTRHANTLHIQIDSPVTLSAEQRVILQQQVRQHVQLAASNFLQLYVHPVHWKMAPAYKEYLSSLVKLVEKNKDSVVNVCNLQPAMDLVTEWEQTVSQDTPENRMMIDFIQGQLERNRRRAAQNCLYVGNFHEKFLETVANSTVFLYPYLLPAIPFRPDGHRRNFYLSSEDRYIVLGLDQFRRYVEANPKLYRVNATLPRARRGLSHALALLVRHMMPWSSTRSIAAHIHSVNGTKDESNPIYRYFKHSEVPAVEHKILPYNPRLTLYDLPEHEMPKVWVRYLAKKCRRFRTFLHKRITTLSYTKSPEGMSIDPGVAIDTGPVKLPEDYTKKIVSGRSLLHEIPNVEEETPQLTVNAVPNMFKLVKNSSGQYLLQINADTQTVDSNSRPITTPTARNTQTEEHCTCCRLLRKFTKKQKLITDYFGKKRSRCDCDIKYPKITGRLKMLVRNHKNVSQFSFEELERRLIGIPKENDELDVKELTYVLKYQLKVFSKASMSRRIYVKKRVHNALAGFDLDKGDPLKLAEVLFKAYDVELVDLYMDFLGFLTPEQVDRIDKFKEYFIRNCVQDLMDKIEEHVDNKGDRCRMLSQIRSIFADGQSSACDMCSGLLRTMEGYPALLQYTFSLFPHRKDRSKNCPVNIEETDINDTRDETTVPADYYEADHSSTGEDSDSNQMEVDETLYVQPDEHDNGEHRNEEQRIDEEQQTDDEQLTDDEQQANDEQKTQENEYLQGNAEQQNNNMPFPIKEEPTEIPEPTDTYESKCILEFTETTNKNDNRNVDDLDSEPSLSINIAEIKIDPPDWRREEDKLILEVLQDLLTPQERKNKTVAVILNLLEEKDVYSLISDSLDRPIREIKERLLYLLSLLVISERCDT